MDPALLKSLLAQAERLVAESEVRISRQRAILEQLAQDHHDTRGARSVLQEFERSQVLFTAERDRLRGEFAGFSPAE